MHAPGPWRKGTTPVFGDPCILDAMGRVVCKMPYPHDLAGAKESGSNMNMIAACPEAYEAMLMARDGLLPGPTLDAINNAIKNMESPGLVPIQEND